MATHRSGTWSIRWRPALTSRPRYRRSGCTRKKQSERSVGCRARSKQSHSAERVSSEAHGATHQSEALSVGPNLPTGQREQRVLPSWSWNRPATPAQECRNDVRWVAIVRWTSEIERAAQPTRTHTKGETGPRTIARWHVRLARARDQTRELKAIRTCAAVGLRRAVLERADGALRADRLRRHTRVRACRTTTQNRIQRPGPHIQHSNGSTLCSRCISHSSSEPQATRSDSAANRLKQETARIEWRSE